MLTVAAFASVFDRRVAVGIPQQARWTQGLCRLECDLYVKPKKKNVKARFIDFGGNKLYVDLYS